jgi:hypothetical protein
MALNVVCPVDDRITNSNDNLPWHFSFVDEYVSGCSVPNGRIHFKALHEIGVRLVGNASNFNL